MTPSKISALTWGNDKEISGCIHPRCLLIMLKLDKLKVPEKHG
jgi:hypothetical protein